MMNAFSTSSVDRSTGGGERARTDDPQLAKLVLSLLSYTPQEAFGITSGPWLFADGRSPSAIGERSEEHSWWA